MSTVSVLADSRVALLESELKRAGEEVARWQDAAVDAQEKLRRLAREAILVLDGDIEGCTECDWGNGSKGVDSDGDPCHLCGPLRDLRERLKAEAAVSDV